MMSLLLFLLASHVACGEMASWRCINACTKTLYLGNKLVCRKCAQDPPIDAAMCHCACKFTARNPWSLTDICDKCFQLERAMMKSICEDECISTGYNEENQLCRNCIDHRVHQTRHS